MNKKFLGFSIVFLMIVLGIAIYNSGDTVYIQACNCTLPNVTDVNVYNCTSRTVGSTGYDYTTNELYYCNTTDWVKL